MIHQLYQNVTKAKLTIVFIVLNIFIILALLISNTYLITENHYYESLEEQLSVDQIAQLLNIQNKYEYFGYIFIFLINIFRYFTIALSIYTGSIIFGLKVKFKELLGLVIFAEFIFLIPLVLKFVWFYYFQSNYTLEDFQFFYPLSLLNIFETGTISQLWIYPLQLLNIFEVGYWFLLAFGIKQLINSDFDKSLRLVLCSYLPAMLLWVVFVMFLTVTLNPNI